jgi:sulfite reductase (NADPH) hemoprotein beta-component
MCEESGLRNDSIVMRMTGCPNGCARPYLGGEYPKRAAHTVRRLTKRMLPTEVAFVGKALGSYLMLLGGGYYGQRLNKIYRG